MNNQIQIFNPKFDDEQLESDFLNFFTKYNLTALFTNEHRAGDITVAWIDARSVVSPTGSYHRTLKEFADLLSMGDNNKTFEESIFKIIYQAGTFQKFMMRIRKIIEFASTVDPKHLFNLWNIVWYAKPLN